MPETPVHADFLNDVRGQLASYLHASGHTVPAPLSVDAVAFRYFDLRWRELPAQPRTVVKSRELAQQVLTADHQAGLDAIVEDAEAGRSLVPYFSKMWKQLDLRDPLFDDWYVRHLHLGGRTIESKGFVKRTGPVLFAYINNDTLYMIDVMEHDTTKEPTAFAKKRIVQILHDNWPDVIKHGKTTGFTHLSPNDDESRRLLSRNRKGFNASLGVEVADGTVYSLISGGRLFLSMTSNALLRYACQLEESVKSEFKNMSARKDGVVLGDLHFQLDIKHIARGVEIDIRETQVNHTVLRGGKPWFPAQP
jgi:hypothetical protein